MVHEINDVAFVGVVHPEHGPGLDLWVGGKLATQQDLFALFWARGAERYLVPGGTVAMVLPYAAMNAPAS